MQCAGDRIAQDLRLRDADQRGVPDARRRMVAAILRQSADAHVAHEPLRVEREERTSATMTISDEYRVRWCHCQLTLRDASMSITREPSPP